MSRRRPPLFRALPRWIPSPVFLAWAPLVVACGDGDVTDLGEGLGTIVVSVRTVGVELDPDGYSLRVDGGEPRSVDINGTATFTDVPSGPRELTLDGVAVTCDAEGGPEREVAAPRFSTVHVLWSVVCTAKPIVFSSLRPGSLQRHLYRMNVDGTGVKQLGTVVGYSPRWSPDGTKILYGGVAGLYVMDADGSGIRLVTEGVEGTWSPDGTRIAFTRYDDWGFPAEIHTIAFDGSDRRVIANRNPSYHPDWGPDGRIAFVESLQRVPGRGAYESWLSLMNADGTGVTRLSGEELLDGGTINRPAWSPDGSRIAFSVVSLEESAIFTVGADGGTVRRRSGFLAMEDEPRWFSDGTTLLFTTYQADRVKSELRMGSHDSDASSSVSHFVSDDRGGDVRPARDATLARGPR